MNRMFLMKIFFILFVMAPVPFAQNASAFPPGSTGKCADCHTLEKAEAAKLLKTERFKAEVKDIRMSPVKGLWEVEVAQGQKTFVIYVDFAKKHLVEGRFTPLEQLEKSTQLKKVDVSKIPLDNAIVIGNPKAAKKIIIFDDPDCPYCAKLHEEAKKVLAKRKDIAFYIKMFPLPIHPEAYDKSKAIVCAKSQKLLEDAFAGKKLPKPDCETKEIDNNIKLAEELGLRGTPAIIFPDGRLLPGFVPENVLLDILDNQQK